jgi:hypothetical protein
MPEIWVQQDQVVGQELSKKFVRSAKSGAGMGIKNVTGSARLGARMGIKNSMGQQD